MPSLYAIPYYSKYLGVATSGILTGILLTHSTTLTPLLLASPDHSIILRQFHTLQTSSKKTITRLSLSSSLFFFTASYLRVTKSWPSTIRCWIAGALAISIIPYSWLIMKRTERKLETLYEEELEQKVDATKEGQVVVRGEVRALVDWWGVKNLGRVGAAAAAFLVGIETVRRW
ncbi:hypothetical protein TWF225_010769 [Orbilia oligospora]|uniref:Uncharacterized protein n=1 Tax=Orbilia oligospora TaxID=2813651 RepID=A0A7C8PP85_ORBOL|nr:hypothetical protein TWF751_007913 [Orbilia oligospora]KAF3170466.1 hypothetical protein TWF225_010769 [Orbilia oligospora]KAF3235346.1 hypothetical protein TWF128_001867 [Orbilia oligospora]KAF3243981.1 hypothetical protein TWF217_011090 [Orbilia oligospora]KAF3291759.1 hypothetical protein TWF132_006504 [Orbilia oligospora]